jgi:heme A synthase
MTGARLLRLALAALAALLALALAALVALILPSADNGPYMTPFAILLVALCTALILLGYAGGWRDGPDAPPADRPGDGSAGEPER